MDFDRASMRHFLNNPNRLKNLLKRARNLANVANYGDTKKNLMTKVDGEVYFFGSRIMEMSHPKSDIDVFISIDGIYWDTMDRTKNGDLLKRLGEIMKDDEAWKGINVVLTAKVPVIKAFYIPRNRQCDITITNGSGVENTKLFRYMYKMQPEALKMYHFVRLYIHFGKLNFKRYMVSMLVTFYLQSCNLMPSIKDIQSRTPKKVIGGWNVQFDETLPLSSYGVQKMNNYMTHVRGFFDFYKNFNFEHEIVIPYLGHSITKRDYIKHPDLAEFHDQLTEYKVNFPMAVTDAIKLDYNCATDVGLKRYNKFIRFCDEAGKTLAENSF